MNKGKSNDIRRAYNPPNLIIMPKWKWPFPNFCVMNHSDGEYDLCSLLHVLESGQKKRHLIFIHISDSRCIGGGRAQWHRPYHPAVFCVFPRFLRDFPNTGETSTPLQRRIFQDQKKAEDVPQIMTAWGYLRWRIVTSKNSNNMKPITITLDFEVYGLKGQSRKSRKSAGRKN